MTSVRAVDDFALDYLIFLGAMPFTEETRSTSKVFVFLLFDPKEFDRYGFE